MNALTGLLPLPPPHTHTKGTKNDIIPCVFMRVLLMCIIYIRCPPGHMFNLLGLQFRNNLQEW